ncbi:TPM domain-containing protein [Methylobacterium sp. R2-1]|uniref:TPM domain-containing protein n=1 Tax=Methylobacterium sp. R2-1 TaxID=2587064 RepID=UPI00160E0873|nr:TPM domain-containing protein [Methylobacterium sp. R2-1]MBB2962333.1 putative membrane protein [Methylobacterium sp. R2-1]
MTGSATILGLSERERIAAAIGRAEAGTSGEIVVLVAARAGLYRSPGLALALAVALALPWPLILLSDLGAGEIALAQAASVLATLLLTLNGRLRVALTPRRWRRERAHAAARREFFGHGLAGTRGRTGVLVYVALAERYAEIVADRGVRSRVEEAQWHAIVSDLLSAAGRGALGEGLVTAVERVGAVLQAELPGSHDDNQLPNRVIVLD